MNPQPGEVWLADLGLAGKTRPVIIVSRRDPDPPRALVLYVPLTTYDATQAEPLRGAAATSSISRPPSVANTQGLDSIPTVRLERKIGRVSDEVMTQVKKALAYALDLESSTS
jgi:mRNA interferase MazF